MTRGLFSSLEGFSDEQIRAFATQKNPPAMEGTWILTAPNGREYIAESPLKCCAAEMHERIPPLVGIARIYTSTFLSDNPDGESEETRS